MNLSDQVVSLELGKKLKSLNVKQESLFYWEINCSQFSSNGEPAIINSEFHDSITGEWGDCHSWHSNENYSAFTVSELLEMLPIWTDISKREEDYHCRYFHRNNSNVDHSFGKNPVDALAKILIHLLENKLMEIPK